MKYGKQKPVVMQSTDSMKYYLLPSGLLTTDRIAAITAWRESK